MSSTSSMEVASEAFHVVDIRMASSGVVLVKFGEGARQTTAALSDDYTDFCHAVDADGFEPLRKTFGSLLHCNDGIMTIVGNKDEIQYRIHAQPPPPQPSGETAAALEEMARDYLAKKNTIVLSQVTNSAKTEILDMLHLREQGAPWLIKPANTPIWPAFQWLAGDEDSERNRKAYMAHLITNVCLPSQYSMADVQPDRSSLSVDLPGKEKRRKISGTTDVVVAQVRNIENETVRQNVEALFELKTPKNMRSKNHNPQAICEHLAASYLNPRHAVVTVLTDLNDSWTFYWFAKDADDGSAVSLWKLKLPDNEEGSAGLAKYILENLFDKSHADTLPSTFVDRLPFEAVQAAMICKSYDARGHDDRKKGGGHGGNCGGDFNDQEKQHGPPQNPPPASGHEKNAGVGKGGSHNREGGDGNGGTQAMGAAEFLSLFAPPSSRDVANELDLLDMVDEDDQYNIVRSFVAKHIVPNMTGHE